MPVIQASIGGFSCPELAASVRETSGLGTLVLSWDSIETCRRKIEQTQMATRVGINFVIEWDQMERLDACLEADAKIISFFWEIRHVLNRPDFEKRFPRISVRS